MYTTYLLSQYSLLPFKAVKIGVDGIFVSNHGARQLDTVPATIDALPSIVAAVGGRAEVIVLLCAVL